MLNLNHLLAVIALLLISQTSAIKITREQHFQTQNPYAVAIGSKIFIVSKNNSHIHVDSSDKTYRPCTAALDSNRDRIDGRFKAIAVGSKKILISGVDHVNDVHTVKFVHHTTLLIDPFSCSSKFVVGVGFDRVPVHFAVTKAQLVPRSASKFDVFLLGPQNCAPCRFDTNGNVIHLEKQVKSDFSVLANFYVQPLMRSGGSAYAIIRADGSTVLKVLDKDFKASNEISLTNTIFDMSTASGAATSYIGITYNTANSPYKFFYALYDSTLRRLFEKPLPSLGSKYLGLGAQLSIDSRGNSYVSFQQLNSDEGDTTVSLTAFDVKGNKIGGSNNIVEISTGGYEIQTLLVEDRELCLVVHEFDDPHDITNVKCIDITKKI